VNLLPIVAFLADAPTQTGPEFGEAGPAGLLVVVLLLIGVFALVWSMNRHLKRLPETFDAAPAGQEASGADDPPADVPDREGEGPRHEPSG
jgi:hypothetical protein